MKFQFKSLKARILTGFFSLILLVCLFTVYYFVVNSSMKKNAEELIERQLTMLSMNQTVASSITVRAAATTNFITTGDDKYLDIFQTYSELAEENNSLLNEMDRENIELRNRHVEAARQWRKDIEEKVFANQIAGKTELAIENLRLLNDQATVVRKGYDELVQMNSDNIEELGSDIIQSSSNTKLIGLAVSVILIVLGSGIAILTSNSVTRPTGEVTGRIVNIAGGRFNGFYSRF